jgi:transcriptional regulator with XRE-family HTH domain
MDTTGFGKFLRKIRERENLNISSIAQKVGISQPFWGRLEQEKIIPSAKTIEKIISTFNLDPITAQLLYAHAGIKQIRKPWTNFEYTTTTHKYFITRIADIHNVQYLGVSILPVIFQTRSYLQYISFGPYSKDDKITEEIREKRRETIWQMRVQQKEYLLNERDNIIWQILLADIIFSPKFQLDTETIKEIIQGILTTIKPRKNIHLRLAPIPKMMIDSNLTIYEDDFIITETLEPIDVQLIAKSTEPDYFTSFRWRFDQVWWEASPEQETIERLTSIYNGL